MALFCIRLSSDGEAQEESVKFKVRKFSKKIAKTYSVSNQINHQAPEKNPDTKEVTREKNSVPKEVSWESNHARSFQSDLKN